MYFVAEAVHCLLKAIEIYTDMVCNVILLLCCIVCCCM